LSVHAPARTFRSGFEGGGGQEQENPQEKQQACLQLRRLCDSPAKEYAADMHRAQ
jgi:hypothetical protein